MSLETPIKIRMLQRKLYQKAKEEPDYRFYLLYDKIYREDILNHAYALAKSNQGAPGVDEQSFTGIEAAGLGEWLNGIRNDLRAKTYKPQAVRRVKIGFRRGRNHTDQDLRTSIGYRRSAVQCAQRR
jgi:RNA-directed DNA polymerase